VSWRIETGDCLDLLRPIPDASVSVICTSPPYNIGTKYRAYDDSIGRQQYLEWTRTWLLAVARVMTPGASLFLNVGGTPSDPWIPHDIAAVARQFFVLQNEIHWIKSISVDEQHSVGHYKPINSKRFVNGCHEYVLHLTLGGYVRLDRLAIGVPYADENNAKRWGNGGKRCRGNTWFLPYPTINKSRTHPAVFPVELPERCIELHGVKRARLVLDPFVGIGSTALACIRLGVDFVGFDIDPEYCSIARESCEKGEQEQA